MKRIGTMIAVLTAMLLWSVPTAWAQVMPDYEVVHVEYRQVGELVETDMWWGPVSAAKSAPWQLNFDFFCGKISPNEGEQLTCTITHLSGDPALTTYKLTASPSAGVTGWHEWTASEGGTFSRNVTFASAGQYDLTIDATDASQTGSSGRRIKSIRFNVGSMPTGQPPVAATMSVTTRENTPVVIDLTLNADDPDGDDEKIVISTVNQPAHGLVVKQGAQNVLFTPNAGYAGSDAFTYTLVDEDGLISNLATVTVYVEAVAAPVCTLNGTPSTIQSGGNAVLNWTQSAGASLVLNQGIGAVGTGPGSRTVSPSTTTTYTGTVTLSGKSGTCSTTITVELVQENRPPVITSINGPRTITASELPVTATYTVVATDPDGDVLMYDSDSSEPSIDHDPVNASSSNVFVLTFHEVENDESIIFRVKDPHGAEDTETILVTVRLEGGSGNDDPEDTKILCNERELEVGEVTECECKATYVGNDITIVLATAQTAIIGITAENQQSVGSVISRTFMVTGKQVGNATTTCQFNRNNVTVASASTTFEVTDDEDPGNGGGDVCQASVHIHVQEGGLVHATWQRCSGFQGTFETKVLQGDVLLFADETRDAEQSFTLGSCGLHEFHVRSSDRGTFGGWTKVPFTVPCATDVEQDGIPAEFALEDNYPNPANPTTTIRFALPVAAHVDIIVYDVMGREVRRVNAGEYSAGMHNLHFDATGLPSGTYLYVVLADKFVGRSAMVVLK